MECETISYQQLTRVEDDGLVGSILTLSNVSGVESFMEQHPEYISSSVTFYGPDGQVDSLKQLDAMSDYPILEKLCARLHQENADSNLDNGYAFQSVQPPPPPPPVPEQPKCRTRTAARRHNASAESSAIAMLKQDRGQQVDSDESVTSYGMVTGSYHEDGNNSGTHRERERKKCRRYEEGPSNDPALERSRKNAIIAKRNRDKKKEMMEELQTKLNIVEARNQEQEALNKKLVCENETHKQEIAYLKKVLANSAIGEVLKRLEKNSRLNGNLRLTTSFETKSVEPQSKPGSSEGGICLHVNGQQVSIALCATCAQIALEATSAAVV